MINHDVSLSSHGTTHAIIGIKSQVLTSDNRHCDSRKFAQNSRVSRIKAHQPDAITVLERLDRLGVSQKDLAGRLGIEENKVSKIRAGIRRIGSEEFRIAMSWLDEVEAADGYVPQADVPPDEQARDYLPVKVLLSFGGMGGGGAEPVEGDSEVALIPRTLIEDELHARPDDLMLLEVRGESMEPDFLHGDQLLIDLRDKNPVQPGSFALWDGDSYVVKLVERVPQQLGRYRVFSANSRFSAYDVSEEEITIMGRPVWFGRRL